MAARKIRTKFVNIKVNLLPKDSFTESTVGKILDWALTTGRYIVIFTEMVVILTFLQRFNLDRQLSNLNESIFEKQAVLGSYNQVEQEIKQIQAKAQFVEKLDSGVDILTVLDFLSTSAPNDVIFEGLNVSDQVFKLDGIAFSRTSLEDFVEVITQYSGVTDVSLDRVFQSEDSIGLEFVLRVDFSESETEIR